MKILIIKSNKGWNDGIHNVIANIINSIDKKNLVIDVVAEDPLNSFVDLVKNRGGVVFNVSKSMRHPIRYVKQLISIIKAGRYDVVHAHGSSRTLVLEMMAAKMAGCNVRMAHSHNTRCSHRLIHMVMKPLFDAFCNYRVACGSEAGKWMYGKSDFIVINNGIKTERFRFNDAFRKDLRKQLMIDNDDVLIGHVGSFLPVKNQSFLVNLLSELPANYKLIMIGDGPTKWQIMNKVEALGLSKRVFFAGAIDNVNEYLSAIDLVLMPSIYEGLPLSLIEEQANGLKCIVSDNITKECDKTGNVLFLPLNKPELWQSAVLDSRVSRQLDASCDAISAIKENGYDIEDEMKKLKFLYEEAVCHRWKG